MVQCTNACRFCCSQRPRDIPVAGGGVLWTIRQRSGGHAQPHIQIIASALIAHTLRPRNTSFAHGVGAEPSSDPVDAMQLDCMQHLRRRERTKAHRSTSTAECCGYRSACLQFRQSDEHSPTRLPPVMLLRAGTAIHEWHGAFRRHAASPTCTIPRHGLTRRCGLSGKSSVHRGSCLYVASWRCGAPIPVAGADRAG